MGKTDFPYVVMACPGWGEVQLVKGGGGGIMFCPLGWAGCSRRPSLQTRNGQRRGVLTAPHCEGGTGVTVPGLGAVGSGGIGVPGSGSGLALGMKLP